MYLKVMSKRCWKKKRVKGMRDVKMVSYQSRFVKKLVVMFVFSIEVVREMLVLFVKQIELCGFWRIENN